MWCTPPSLASDEMTPEERAQLARLDASARFEREKLRLSMTPVRQTPPAKVVAAGPPSSADKENARPFQPTWEDALFVLDDASSPRAAERAQDQLVDKIVWIPAAEDEVTARVKCIARDPHSKWLLGVELLQPPPLELEDNLVDGLLFVPPAQVALLSMKELLELPPPPPPPPDHDDHARPPAPNDSDKDAPPLATFDDTAPPVVPSWAQQDQLILALHAQLDRPLPPELNNAPQTCSIVNIFNRPSLAAKEGRETSDWSRDD